MFYKIINAIIRVVTYFIFPYKFYGKENMPQTGGALIVCNHKTFFDFLYITMSLKRPVALIAKQELFKNRFLAWLFDKYGAFPINRGGNDLGAVKKSIGLLRDGKAVLLFPEGTRNKGIKIGEVLGGAALIAAKAGASFVAPYVNRLDNIIADGCEVVAEITKQLSLYNLDCRVLAASFKTAEQVHKCASAGCHSVTVTSDILKALISNPMTDVAVATFEKDWENVYGDKTILEF